MIKYFLIKEGVKMIVNEAVISHYKCAAIPFDQLKNLVNINETYLREKDTWYKINGNLKYFKVRNDYRLFTEQFFSKFGKEVVGLETIDYELASVRVTDGDKDTKKIGLLSDNFQKPGYNYYLVSELYNSEISDLVCYSNYSLMSLLSFFNETVEKNDYEKIKDFLIRLFISDSFMLQADRNFHNIGFKIPKFDGIPYTQRLRPYLVKGFPGSSKIITIEGDVPKIKGLTPTPVYDNEKILGIDHKNVQSFKPGMIWRPLFPFSSELFFETDQKAKKISDDEYDGLDPNLIELYISFPKESKALIERLAYDNEYKSVLEKYLKRNQEICLQTKTLEYIESVLEERRKVFQKVLNY
jgi:hypothetical protein